MTSNPFSSPAPATGGLDLKSLLGALLIVEPLSVEDGVQTVHGPATAVRATVHVVDGPNANEVHEDVLIFPKVLVGQLRTRLNQRVLGRLGQGLARPGQSAPWILQEAEAADIAAGTEYLNRQQSGQFAAPAAQQQPAQQAPAGAPPF